LRLDEAWRRHSEDASQNLLRLWEKSFMVGHASQAAPFLCPDLNLMILQSSFYMAAGLLDSARENAEHGT
jgi:hypothetical protein